MLDSRSKCKNVFGQELTLEIRELSPGICKEFVVAAPTFNYGKWLTLTASLSFFSLAFEIYIKDLHILGAIFIFLCLALLLKLRRKIKSESLLVISALGFQHTTTYASGRTEIFFVDKSRVKDLVINEGVSMHRFLFYLAIILRTRPPAFETTCASSPESGPSSIPSKADDEPLEGVPSINGLRYPVKLLATDPRLSNPRIATDDVVYPLFQSLWPRLDALRIIYSGVQNILLEERRKTL